MSAWRFPWLILHGAVSVTTAVFAGTPLAHAFEKTNDWVVVYAEDPRGRRQAMIVTETVGPRRPSRRPRARARVAEAAGSARRAAPTAVEPTATAQWWREGWVGGGAFLDRGAQHAPSRDAARACGDPVPGGRRGRPLCLTGLADTSPPLRPLRRPVAYGTTTRRSRGPSSRPA
jgi:hypothetical protein